MCISLRDAHSFSLQRLYQMMVVNKAAVHSDRGIEHLLMLLVGKVESNSSLIDEANKKYTNSLSITNTCEKQESLNAHILNSHIRRI